MEYKIQKCPPTLLNKERLKKVSFPLEEMKTGEMFEAEAKVKGSIYNAIKHRRVYVSGFKEKVFTIKTLSNGKIACIRLR